MASDLINISHRILQIMSEQNLSYGELSKRTGIPKSALQRYATGETVKIPLTRIQQIANATGVSAAWIMGWEETEPSATQNTLHPSDAQNEQPLTDKQQEIMNICSKLSNEDIDKVIEYVEFIKSKRNQ